jgi:hypothetical protein
MMLFFMLILSLGVVVEEEGTEPLAQPSVEIASRSASWRFQRARSAVVLPAG